jgi:endonuclease/exonuclease/phosphatase family metal-dependent hydrolase
VAWAYLRGKNGAGPFLAISLHLDSSKEVIAENSRIAVGQALSGWVNLMNSIQGMSGTPTILMADLNSYAKRQPNGAQKGLTSAGWIDAHTARSRRNVQYSTINYNPRLGEGAQGFPSAPYQFQKSRKNPKGEASRIDYIMGYGAGLKVIDYEVVVYLNGKAFNTDYQASDHQMVKATFAFS